LRYNSANLSTARGKMNESETIDWLLEGDPAIRWQVQRDLLGEKAAVYEEEQQKVALEGWGARFLSLQDPDGRWGKGLYSPKWISTTYTMLTLRQLGLPPKHPQTMRACQVLLEKGLYKDGGINFSSTIKYSETCISGMVLSILAHFGYDEAGVHRLAEHMLEQQMPDRGWNCQSYRGATHSSFHTTILALEGLHEYEKLNPPNLGEVQRAQAEGREFLLIHRLYRSHRTGEVVDVRMTRMPFPPRWYFDFLRALDYFQATQAERDTRLSEAIELLKSKRKKDGLWRMNSGPSGLRLFEMEKAGKPSRINTLRALRVLKWWETAT